MNFAKNSVCLQCDSNRPKRQLLPGEWECPEYVLIFCQSFLLAIILFFEHAGSFPDRTAGLNLFIFLTCSVFCFRADK